MSDMVTIPRKEYERLRALDLEYFEDQVLESLDNLKNGRIIRVA